MTNIMQHFFIQPHTAAHVPHYAADSSIQDVVGWMAVAIVIILIVGMLLYFFLVWGNIDRDRQNAMARVRAARGTTSGQYGRAADRNRESRRYEGTSEDMPEAVRAAYQDIRKSQEGYDEQYGEQDGADAGQLEAEDRQLLWEEAAETEIRTAAPEEEEVLFIDDEADAGSPGGGTAEGGIQPAKDEFITGPLALLLLQKDIEKAVKEGPGYPQSQKGPAWSEGRPVFSKPLEAPTEVAPVSAAQPPPLDMEEFSAHLKSLATTKKLESRKLEEERRLRDEKRAREEARRREEATKKEEKLRREIRGRVRAGISEAQRQDVPAGPPGVSLAEEEARMAEEQKKLEEERRREERRRRWLELQKKHEVETIEDVLSRIGIR
jgi:hypothetical protein